MSKKRKPAPAKKKKAFDRTSPEEIRKLWTGAAKGGLGSGTTFDKEIFDKYVPALEKKIKENLDGGAKFDAAAEKATKQVGKDIGVVCKMFTKGSIVSKDTFDVVFKFMKNHPLCPATGGAGGWCDIGIP